MPLRFATRTENAYSKRGRVTRCPECTRTFAGLVGQFFAGLFLIAAAVPFLWRLQNSPPPQPRSPGSTCGSTSASYCRPARERRHAYCHWYYHRSHRARARPRCCQSFKVCQVCQCRKKGRNANNRTIAGAHARVGPAITAKICPLSPCQTFRVECPQASERGNSHPV